MREYTVRLVLDVRAENPAHAANLFYEHAANGRRYSISVMDDETGNTIEVDVEDAINPQEWYNPEEHEEEEPS